MRNLAKLLLLVAVCFAFTGLSQAQYDNGSLVGTIHDATNAPIPTATVTATNIATSTTVEVKTNSDGDYSFPQLRVGVYKISAKADGFSESIADNVTIAVGGRNHIDLTLKIGSTETTVEVNGVALQIETESSQRDQTVTQYQSAAFPLVSRNYSDLLGLVSGVRQAPTAATTSSINSLVRAGAYNVNGQRSMFNNFLLDGMDNNAYGESNQGFDNQIIAVPPDSVAQFSVVTNNESAEYGRSSGATINVATASGTNAFHGVVYEFLRNTSLNATGFFKPTTGSVPFKKPTLNRNQFGGTFGGPILKDKLFFFLDYEGFRQTLKPLSVLTLPTLDELNGKLVADVKDPRTGTPYPKGAPIPTGVWSPLSLAIVNKFKTISGLPQSGSAATGLASNNYAVQVPFTDKSDKGDLRLDYQQSPATSYFLRVSERKETGVNYPSIPLPLDGQTNGTIRVLNQQVAVGFNHFFGSNKIIDARLGLSKTKAGKYTLSIGDPSFSIPGLPSNPVVAGGLPSIGITGFSAFGRQATNPQWQNPSLLDPKVNFTWVKKNHTLKFGYEFERVWMAVNDNNPLYGGWSYGGAFSAVGTAVSDSYWADFLFGTTSAYQLANYYVVHLRQNMHNIYAQDDWKVNNFLTLNLGLRWEYGSPYYEQNNNVSNFDPTTQTLLTITPGATSGNGLTKLPSTNGVYGKTLMDPDLNDFAPRVGFSAQITPKTVLRGGFGMSYVHYYRAGSGNILAINGPQALFVSVTQPTPTPGNQCPAGAPSTSCYVRSEQGFPTSLTTQFNPLTDNITWVPRNTRDSYVESYYLSFQQQLAKNILFDVAYVGNHGVKLQGFLNGNQKNPSKGFTRPYSGWNDITQALNAFYSHYDSLQARYEQRMTGGLTLLNSFTWQHSLDNASASLEANTPSPQDGNNIKADYAQSDYNLPISNVTSLVYELPFGRGRKWLNSANGFTDTVLGGWQVSAINTAQAGTPFNIGYSPNSNTAVSPQIGATYRGANAYRPFVVPGQPITQGKSNRAAGTGYINYINYKAFVLPATRDGANNLLSPFGNASRNPGRSPAFYETNISVNKKFSTPLESLKVEFRSEFYNIFNHTNLYLPGSGLSGTLGTIPSGQNLGAGATPSVAQISGGVPTGGGQITSTFEPRIIQFGLKIIY